MMHPHAYRDFKAAMGSLASDASALDVLEAVVGWVGMHQSTLSAPPFSDYGFDQIIQIVGRVDCYRPNDLGDRAVERIQRSISGKTRGKSASIAMFVRDLMEELLAHLLVCRVCRASRWAGGSTLSGQRVRYREASELDAWEQV